MQPEEPDRPPLYEEGACDPLVIVPRRGRLLCSPPTPDRAAVDHAPGTSGGGTPGSADVVHPGCRYAAVASADSETSAGTTLIRAGDSQGPRSATTDTSDRPDLLDPHADISPSVQGLRVHRWSAMRRHTSRWFVGGPVHDGPTRERLPIRTMAVHHVDSAPRTSLPAAAAWAGHPAVPDFLTPLLLFPHSPAPTPCQPRVCLDSVSSPPPWRRPVVIGRPPHQSASRAPSRAIGGRSARDGRSARASTRRLMGARSGSSPTLDVPRGTFVRNA